MWVPVLSASFRGRPAGQGAKNGLDHRVGFLHRGWIPMPWEGTWTAAFLKDSSAKQSKLGCQIFKDCWFLRNLGAPVQLKIDSGCSLTHWERCSHERTLMQQPDCPYPHCHVVGTHHRLAKNLGALYLLALTFTITL